MENQNLNLTEMELVALHSITHSDFYEQGRDSIVWDFSVYDICSLPKRSRAGVYSSLVQKGIIHITEKNKQFYMVDGVKTRNPYYDKNDFGTIYITPEGYSLLDKLQLINEYGSFIK